MEQALKNYGWVIHLLVVALCAWLLASMVAASLSLLLTQPPLAKATLPISAMGTNSANEVLEAKAKILERNLMARNLQPSIEPPLTVDPKLTAQKTDLKLNLIGTVVAIDASQSVATLLNGKEKERVKIGEKIEKQHEVKAIKRGRVEFINQKTRRLEYLGFDEIDTPKSARAMGVPGVGNPLAGATIVQEGEGEYTIDRAEWEQLLAPQNLNQLLTQAVARPNMVGDKTDGFRIYAIRPGSIYQKLGIQNGDVLTTVNGSSINSIGSALGLFEALKTETNFEIQVKRNNAPKTMRYNVR